jgi:hypothetical protein
MLVTSCIQVYSSLNEDSGEKNSYTVARYSTTRQAAGNRWEGTRLDTEYLALMLRGKLDCLRLMGKSGKKLSCTLKYNLF